MILLCTFRHPEAPTRLRVRQSREGPKDPEILPLRRANRAVPDVQAANRRSIDWRYAQGQDDERSAGSS